MVKTIATILLALTAAVPSEGFKEAAKEPLIEDPAIIVRVLPKRTEAADGNYVLDNESKAKLETRYEEMKKNLDEKFERMFELKAELDAAQNKISEKWEEYHALREKYNRELKRIISAWLTSEGYCDDCAYGKPVPLDMHRAAIEK